MPALAARILAATLIGLAVVPACAARADGGPLVAVAANMSDACERIVQAFGAQGGGAVRLTFGASGNLARQIMRGAPVELFVSADEAYPARLTDAGLTRDAGAIYATGQLVLYLPPHSPLSSRTQGSVRTRFEGTLRDGALKRLAMANPEHAPYGRAARESLEYLGLWDGLQGRLVLGESVAQSARFARTHDVQAALLPLSLAIAPALADGRRLAVPAAWHRPIHQRMVLLAGAGQSATALYRFILGPVARGILADAGYLLP